MEGTLHCTLAMVTHLFPGRTHFERGYVGHSVMLMADIHIWCQQSSAVCVFSVTATCGAIIL